MLQNLLNRVNCEPYAFCRGGSGNEDFLLWLGMLRIPAFYLIIHNVLQDLVQQPHAGMVSIASIEDLKIIPHRPDIATIKDRKGSIKGHLGGPGLHP